MAKRRQLKDAMADPIVENESSIPTAADDNPSPSLQKVVISAVSLMVGVAAGIFLNRYLKFL
jgi:hypothetical protein